MGFLSSLFGGGGSKPATTTQVTTSKLPDEIAPKVKEIADEAKRLYDERVAEGYVPYEGATIAPYTQQELDSQAGIEGLIGTSAPLQQEALGITRQLGERFTGDTAQEYMNPYQQAVIDVEKRKAQEDFETRILPQFEKQGVAAGGMSGLGSRAGVQAALLGDAQAQRLGDIQSRGLQQAYNQAQQDFTAQKIREQQQATELSRAGPAMFASGLAEQGALAQVGEGRRGLAQEALDEAYFRFLEERNEPQAAIGQYSSTIYANPLSSMPQTTSTGTQRAAQPSTGSQLLGLGLQAANIYGMGGGSAFGGGGFSMANLFNKAEGGRINDGLSGMVYRQAGAAVGVPGLGDQAGITTSQAEEDEAVAQAAAVAEQKANAASNSAKLNPASDTLKGLSSIQNPPFTYDMINLGKTVGGTGIMSPEDLQKIRDKGLQKIRNEMRTGQRERTDMLASQRLFQDTSASAEFADMEDLIRGPKGYSGSLGQSLVTNAIRQLANPNISIASALADPTGVEKYKTSQDKINSAVVDLRKTRNDRNRAMRAGRSKEDLTAFDKSISDKLAIIKQEAATAEDVGKQGAIYQKGIIDRADKISVIVKRFADAYADQIRAGKETKSVDLKSYLNRVRDAVLLGTQYKFDEATGKIMFGKESLTGDALVPIQNAIQLAQQQFVESVGKNPTAQDAFEKYPDLNVVNAYDTFQITTAAKGNTSQNISDTLGKLTTDNASILATNYKRFTNDVERVNYLRGIIKGKTEEQLQELTGFLNGALRIRGSTTLELPEEG